MTGGGRAPAVELRDIAKKFGNVVAVAGVSLVVHDGELVCFLGPSGCGKTTLLRIIAGLERQNAGIVLMRGRDVSGLPPSQRGYGIVFQSYALFPNLTVARNIGYGLETRGVDRAGLDARVDELLELMSLPAHKHRYPAQLSGGEQQRVALARALAPSPALLLLDEPLSALDARVRLALRQEIKGLQKRLGISTIMVTHDQEEALAMADRIVVMNHGTVEQVGTPAEIYGAPRSLFVARFVGQMNLLRGTADVEPGWARVGGVAVRLSRADGLAAGTPLTLAIRPEEVVIGPSARQADNRVTSRVCAVQFLGAFTRLTLALPGDDEGALLQCDVAAGALGDVRATEGSPLTLALPPSALRVFPGPVAR